MNVYYIIEHFNYCMINVYIEKLDVSVALGYELVQLKLVQITLPCSFISIIKLKCICLENGEFFFTKIQYTICKSIKFSEKRVAR